MDSLRFRQLAVLSARQPSYDPVTPVGVASTEVKRKDAWLASTHLPAAQTPGKP